MDAARMQSIVVRLTELLAGGDGLGDRRTDLVGRDLVGGVVAVRGLWWGVVIIRCDRSLAIDLADGATASEAIDDIMRRLAALIGRVATMPLDLHASLSAPVVLAADNALWEPSQAQLQQRVEAHIDGQLVVVEVHRRRRSGEVETAGTQGG
jgi:hypothetical protein